MDQTLNLSLTGRKRVEDRNIKIWISRERKELFSWNQKHLSQFLVGYYLVKHENLLKNSEHKALNLLDLSQEVFLNCYKHSGIRLMTWLRLVLSHLREHKFNYNFQNWINPFCSCGTDIKSTSYFFLHCPLFVDKRITLLTSLCKVDCKLIFFNRNTNI